MSSAIRAIVAAGIASVATYCAVYHLARAADATPRAALHVPIRPGPNTAGHTAPAAPTYFSAAAHATPANCMAAISLNEALRQIAEIAAARRLSEATLRALVIASTQACSPNPLDAPRVNVLALNLALDLQPGPSR